MGKEEWTSESVLKALLQREADGLPLNRAAVLRQDYRLHQACLRFFGQWPRLLQAAGMDPAKVMSHGQWDQQTIIRRLQERYAQGLPMHALAIQESDHNLYCAAARWFSSWDAALVAAGFAPRQFHRRRPDWTAEAILQVLRRTHREGGKVNHTAFRHDSMSRAAVAIFGCWDAALQAAGIDPAKARVYRKPWTKSTLVAELRRQHRAGLPLNAKDARPVSLRRGANRLYGSWDRALRAAGLEPAKIKYHGVSGVWYGPRPPRDYGRKPRNAGV